MPPIKSQQKRRNIYPDEWNEKPFKRNLFKLLIQFKSVHPRGMSTTAEKGKSPIQFKGLRILSAYHFNGIILAIKCAIDWNVNKLSVVVKLREKKNFWYFVWLFNSHLCCESVRGKFFQFSLYARAKKHFWMFSPMPVKKKYIKLDHD